MGRMDIEWLDIKSIKPYEKNAKRHGDEQVSQIANSLRRFGWQQPIVIDAEGVIIVGHGRFMAAKKLGEKKVPCVRAVDLSEDEVKAYRLADNKTAEFSLWDYGKLDEELAEIMDIDMEEFGFDLPGFDEEPEPQEDDYEPDEAIEPRVKLGDVWQLGEHRLICGDCTDVVILDKLMDGKAPDMVFTDPPYGISVVGDDNVVGNENFGIAKHGKYQKVHGDDTTETAQAAYDLLSQYTDRMIIWGGNYFTEFLPYSDGWLIWDKRGDTGIKNTYADGEMAWCSFHTPVRIYHQLWNGMIREGEKEKRLHPTQKPVKMLSEILQDFTGDGDTILDVFGGSGSTLIACEQTGRRCLMAELSEYYCTVIIDRWETMTGEEAVLVKDGG